MKTTILSLKIGLVGVSLMLLLMSISLSWDLMKDELNWITLSAILLSILYIIIISWDLIKKDFITHTGRFIRNNGNTISVLKENGKIKKYRINYELFVKMRSMEVNQEIEIVLFRRTRAVAQIHLRSSKAV
jgi:hypothetical protein